MNVPDTVSMLFKDANPILITLGDDISTVRMPPFLNKIPLFSLLTQCPGLVRASPSPRHTERQRKDPYALNAVLFNHPFNRHDQFMPNVLLMGQQAGTGMSLLLLLIDAVIIILTRKGGGGRGRAARRPPP